MVPLVRYVASAEKLLEQLPLQYQLTKLLRNVGQHSKLLTEMLYDQPLKKLPSPPTVLAR